MATAKTTFVIVVRPNLERPPLCHRRGFKRESTAATVEFHYQIQFAFDVKTRWGIEPFLGGNANRCKLAGFSKGVIVEPIEQDRWLCFTDVANYFSKEVLLRRTTIRVRSLDPLLRSLVESQQPREQVHQNLASASATLTGFEPVLPP